MNEIEILQQRISKLEETINTFILVDKVVYAKDIKMNDGRNIVLAKGTGTQIGTEATQKLGFYGETPVVQASAINAPSTPGASYNQAVAQTAVDAINSIRTALANIGIIA